MNVTRSRVALVADMDKLWAIGGYDGMKNLSTVRGLLFMTFFVYRYIFFTFCGIQLDRNGIIVPDLVSDPAFSRQRKLFVLFRNLLVFIIRKYCRYVLNGKEGDWKEKLMLGIRIRPNPILTLFRNNLHLYKFCKFSCKLGQLRKKALLPQH